MRPLSVESINSHSEAPASGEGSTSSASSQSAGNSQYQLLVLRPVNRTRSKNVFLVRKQISEQNVINQTGHAVDGAIQAEVQAQLPFTVLAAEERPVNNELRVLKFFDHGSRQGLRKFKNEAELRSKLDPKVPYFVKCHGFNHQSDPLAFTDEAGQSHSYMSGCSFGVYEHCDGGNLWDQLSSRAASSEILSDQDALKRIYRQLFEGINFLHVKLNFAHLNLGLSQVHLDHSSVPKVSGFGYASQVDGFKLKHQHKQNKNQFYFAPELQNSSSSEDLDPRKVDVFALGVMLFTSLFKAPPFEKAKKSDPLFKSLCSTNSTGKDYFFRTHPKTRRLRLDLDLMCLLLRMMHEDPQKRPDLETVLKNKWLHQA